MTDAAHTGGLIELREQMLQCGRDAGLAAVGVAPAAVLQPARDVLFLRKAQGRAADMQFTYRNPERSTDPSRSVPGAAALVAAAHSYHRGDVDAPDAPAGRVARYAWRDHYEALRRGLEAMAEVLRGDGWRADVHADDNHLVDRNVAWAAGLGWYGKNANLLLPDRGSWFVLGGIVTTAPLAATGAPMADGCGPCRRCIDACPTDAIVAPGVVDARRCLAWLVQGPGPIPVEFREALGDRIYGCDDCQEVCPPNREAAPASSTGCGSPNVDDRDDAFIELSFLLTADDDALLDRVGRWYIAGRDPDVVRRTALVVLGNTADCAHPDTRALLERYADDPSPLLREHATWAARRLGLTLAD
jgi:epoxyqueuosine reductase